MSSKFRELWPHALQVCELFVNATVADAACRQLGFFAGGIRLPPFAFGPGRQVALQFVCPSCSAAMPCVVSTLHHSIPPVCAAAGLSCPTRLCARRVTTRPVSTSACLRTILIHTNFALATIG